MHLLAYLEDAYGDIDAYFSTKEDIPHMWPVHYFQKPWAMGIDFFWQCKKGILNYVILRPLMSAVSLIANAFDSREAGNRGLDFRHPYVYTTIVNNFSQTWALYCLVLMFKATKDELSPIRPFAKFAVVKAVVFLSFWQSVLVQLVAWWKPSIFGGDVSLPFCGLICGLLHLVGNGMLSLHLGRAVSNVMFCQGIPLFVAVLAACVLQATTAVLYHAVVHSFGFCWHDC